MVDERFDVVIAGGGLAGGLAALALAARRRDARVALVEAGPRLGGNHTWSFHDADVSVSDRDWLEPLVARRWPGHAVRFPGQTREMAAGYASITSFRFDAVVRARCLAAGHVLACGEEAAEVGPDGVRTTSGRWFRAPVILDARGLADGHGLAGHCGYQKFLGQELELEEDAPDALAAMPTLMDATVEQLDGFRFVYVLPFGPRQLLVEDTYYANRPTLDRALLRERVAAYCAARRLRVGRVTREEAGVLPLPFSLFGSAPSGSPFAIGYRGGWFHPLTGYSVPVAVRVASAVAAAGDAAAVARGLRALWRRQAGQARFCGLLTRLLFTAVSAERRWELLARFYRLPADTIARFYAMDMTMRDRVRLVAGRPPRGLSVRAALAAEVS
ncbi:MAG TPA: lycopene beta-cyclase CrtY [Polyangia bacterium]|nr:lycopene beta-cyclase CrtY [Polyangia bacterium]